ncbi:MAG: tetratricopeptide repeat protein [Steroidobacteraceae bacterium]
MWRQLKARWIRFALVLGVLVGGTGVWALLHPGGMWLQHWRAETSVVSSRFIFGPYPLEDDFVVLEEKGVSTIISLLDPSLPYEKILLAQERALAKQHGMEVLNFPMASILGQSFGKDYLANSKAAAQAAIDSNGVAYIHCYLGLHRAANVRKFLEDDAGVTTATQHGSLRSGRSEDVLALDRANIAFMGGHYEQSLQELAGIQAKNHQATLLEAWSNYRLGRIDQARSGFAKVAAERPDSADAAGGLGFCALQSGDLDEAGRQFNLVLSMHPHDAQAMSGLGHVRHRQGQLAEAKILFGRVLEQYPDDSEAREIFEKLQPVP